MRICTAAEGTLKVWVADIVEVLKVLNLVPAQPNVFKRSETNTDTTGYSYEKNKLPAYKHSNQMGYKVTFEPFSVRDEVPSYLVMLDILVLVQF